MLSIDETFSNQMWRARKIYPNREDFVNYRRIALDQRLAAKNQVQRDTLARLDACQGSY
jgi:hypothetical protein